jgi:hypothetical protein
MHSHPRVFARLTISVALLLAGVASVQAATITLVPNTVNMFRDTRGFSDLGFPPDDVLQYGASVRGGSEGTALSAIHPSGFTDPPKPCAPLAANPNICLNSTPFDRGRLTPWTLIFINGPDRLEVPGPSVVGAEEPAPFPVNVRLTGRGLTPTISWEPPAGFAPDAYRISLFAKDDRLANGVANLIHTAGLEATQRSYATPPVLSSGRTLEEGRPYAIGLQLIETRGHGPLTNNNNALILRRSSSFFSFTARNETIPTAVHLAMVGEDPDPTDDLGAPYVFTVEAVGPDPVTFIEAIGAPGYVYQTGAGNPLFASVVLPAGGDTPYDVVVDGAHSSVRAGERFFFREGGVPSFTVLGIPTGGVGDTKSFVTGVSFAGIGAFTGTMTPIIAPINETQSTEESP